MSICHERVISRPQEGGELDSMAPSRLYQLCDSDSDSLQAKQTKLPQPFLIRLGLQTIFVAFLWTRSSFSTSFFICGAQN